MSENQTLTVSKIDLSTGISEAEVLSKSEIFRWYNKARAAARKGLLDLPRTNRALGILISGSHSAKFIEYSTTLISCDCPDHQYRPKNSPCKHMQAKMIQTRILKEREIT
jgi:hypothetical protein